MEAYGDGSESSMKIKWFNIINGMILALVAGMMLYPFMNVIAISISDYSAFLNNPLMIWPKNVTMAAFTHVLTHPLIFSSYMNTVTVTIVGTVLGVSLTIITAYPLSSPELKGKKIFMSIIIFTMLFNGGLIPNFYLIKSLGLLDTLWALIIPSTLGAFNIILMKNFFESIPSSLKEAAKIDGASDLFVLFKIIIPLSMPIIATIALFISVGYWNNFFSAVIYTRSPENWTIQLLLREIITSASTQLLSSGGNMAEVQQNMPVESIKYATLVVVVLPILCVYPFLQKYFVKGVMVGAVKG